MKLLRQFLSLFRRHKLDAEMDEEMRLHVELQTERNVAAGQSPDEARFAALRQFGNVASMQERAREGRGWVWLEQWGQDLRYAGRQLRRAPGFALVVILTFAVGIGATTAIFSIVHSVLLQPLDFPEPERLVVLRETYPPDGEAGGASWAAYHRWREADSFQSIGAARFGVGNLTGAGEPERATTLEVTTGYFATLGVRPALGRVFQPDEAVAGDAAGMLLSHAFWRKKFGGDPEVIGRVVRLNERSFEVVGVLPPNEQLDMGAGVFVLADVTAAERSNYSPADGPEVLARLKSGVTPTQAEQELAVIAAAMAVDSPSTNKGRGVRVRTLLDDVVRRSNYGMIGSESLLFIFLGAVGLLLLIACTNVSNLLLAQAGARRKEIVMRAALGASQGRIVRQLLGESMLLFFLGGLLGLLFAYWGLLALKPLTSNLPRAGEIALHGSGLVCSLAVILVTSVGFGLVPALHGADPSLIEGTKPRGCGGRRRTWRLRAHLVAIEIILAMVLLCGAGLLLQSFNRLQQVDLGYRQEGIMANRLELPPRQYATPAQQLSLVGDLTERIRALPEVKAVAFTTGMPIFGAFGAAYRIEGRGEDPKDSVIGGLYAAITPDYFRVMGIALSQGRTFAEADSADAPRVIIISEALAKRHFPNGNAIGQQLAPYKGSDDWRTVVGVVADVKQWGPASDTIRAAPGQIYEPFAQSPAARNLLLVVHTDGQAGDIPVALRSVIQAIDPNMPLTRLFNLADGVRYSAAKFRFSTLIGTLFAGLALLLAMVGVYGLVSHAVTERTQEFGVRLALGAQPRDILKLVLEQMGKPVGVAVLAGLGGALAGGKLLNAYLFRVEARDPGTLALVTITLLLVVFFACWLPARRATKVDPVVALRAE